MVKLSRLSRLSRSAGRRYAHQQGHEHEYRSHRGCTRSYIRRYNGHEAERGDYDQFHGLTHF